LEEAGRLMGGRYTHLIGILGSPDAGKTAALVSLYLLLANAKLDGFTFADSDSLMALDALSRGARKWNEGVMPEQMTGHTELGDDRRPGFLHLRLRRRKGDRRTHDLLLPDLPGEWTRQLIDKNEHPRLSFLKRADAFWLVVNGHRLVDPESRNLAVHRVSLLIDRIRQFMTSAPPPRVFLVLTRRDSYDVHPTGAVERVASEARRFAVPLEIAEVASFSDNEQFPPGAGLNELLERTLAPQLHPCSVDESPGTRQMFRYRNESWQTAIAK
jgi:hypothetical protein